MHASAILLQAWTVWGQKNHPQLPTAPPEKAQTLMSLGHKDPADRFIAATAIAKGAALLTADTKLLKWKHTLQRHDAAR